MCIGDAHSISLPQLDLHLLCLQAALEETKPPPPSILNLMLACTSFLFCPCLGFLAIMYAIEVSGDSWL